MTASSLGYKVIILGLQNIVLQSRFVERILKKVASPGLDYTAGQAWHEGPIVSLKSTCLTCTRVLWRIFGSKTSMFRMTRFLREPVCTRVLWTNFLIKTERDNRQQTDTCHLERLLRNRHNIRNIHSVHKQNPNSSFENTRKKKSVYLLDTGKVTLDYRATSTRDRVSYKLKKKLFIGIS